MELFVGHDKICLGEYSHQGPRAYVDYSWHSEYCHKIIGVYTNKKFVKADNYEKFTVDFDAEPGDVVHVLTMEYSSGDSFGNSTGNYEVLWVFKDFKAATKTQNHVLNSGKNESLKIKVESGKTIKLSNPAYGYFEKITGVEITTFLLI